MRVVVSQWLKWDILMRQSNIMIKKISDYMMIKEKNDNFCKSNVIIYNK